MNALIYIVATFSILFAIAVIAEIRNRLFLRTERKEAERRAEAERKEAEARAKARAEQPTAKDLYFALKASEKPQHIGAPRLYR